MKLHNRIIDYLESLTVTQGVGRGLPFKVLPWERRFIRGAFGVDGDAALSVARGGGKTTLIAGIGAASVDDEGPILEPRAETVIVASSFDQGKIDFNHILAFMDARGNNMTDRRRWRVQDSVNKAVIECRLTGAVVKCIGSDPKRAHGLAPKLVIADEPAQWPSTTTDAMHSALKTSMGKIPGSRMIALGTRPDHPDHFFQKMLDGGAAYSQCHAANPTDKPFQERTWRKANPSLSHMPDLLKRIRAEADDARRDSSLLPMFKALRLNLGMADHEIQLLINADTWRAAEADINMSGGYALGLDLGTSASMSAAAGYWPDTGALDVMACFGDTPGLAERGLADGVGRKYCDMSDRGELITSVGRVSKLPDLLSEILERWGKPSAIICDRWREAELRDALETGGFPIVPLVIRGMGFKDGGQDTRIFQRAVLAGHVHPARSLLLRYAMSEARTISDPAGNQKLAKKTEGQRRLKARDDAAAAAILAVAAGYKHRAKKTQRSVYLGRA